MNKGFASRLLRAANTWFAKPESPAYGESIDRRTATFWFLYAR